MPVYFLDSVVDELAVIDHEGQTLAGPEQACKEALRGLSDIGRDAILAGAGTFASVSVRDEAGAVIATVSVKISTPATSYLK